MARDWLTATASNDNGTFAPGDRVVMTVEALHAGDRSPAAAARVWTVVECGCPSLCATGRMVAVDEPIALDDEGKLVVPRHMAVATLRRYGEPTLDELQSLRR